MNKTFCPIPWIMLATRTNGDVRVCCQTNQGPTQGILVSSKGRSYNLKNNYISDSRNAKLACEVRRDMLQGKRHPECLRCWREEDSGLVSRRMQEIDMWKEEFNEKQARIITNKQGCIPTDFEPVYYDLRLGNLCNLKCRMCFPSESSSWYKEYINIYGENVFNDTHGKVRLTRNKDGRLITKDRDYDWCLQDRFWQDIESKIGFIKHIYIVGGEPLLIKRHDEFLEKCIDMDRAKNIRLEYNTNITVITNRILKLWSEFKQVRIGASIDAVGEINEYIRYPSKWSMLEKNLHKLDTISGNFKVWIACTVMMYNVLYLPEFIKWKLEKQFKRVNPLNHPKPFLTLHPLHTPPFLNIKALPIKAKQVVEDKFKSFYPWFDEWAENNCPEQKEQLSSKLRETLDGYIKYMNQDDWSHELPRFWEITRKLDKLRDQKIENYLPGLYQLIKETESI